MAVIGGHTNVTNSHQPFNEHGPLMRSVREGGDRVENAIHQGEGAK